MSCIERRIKFRKDVSSQWRELRWYSGGLGRSIEISSGIAPALAYTESSLPPSTKKKRIDYMTDDEIRERLQKIIDEIKKEKEKKQSDNS